MRALFFGLLFLFCTTATAGANLSSKPNGQTNGLGAGGSVFYTWGFMYRHHFANNFGVTTSIGGWLN